MKNSCFNDKTYISAEDAHKISDEYSSKIMKDELDWVYEKINSTMVAGRYKVTFSNKSLMSSTQDFLKLKGFKIQVFNGDQREPTHDITISW